MYKIYSRPRIKIPSINNKYKFKISNKILMIIIIILITFNTVRIILNVILPIFDNLCENRAKSIATLVSNEQATLVMNKHSYDELFTVEKDESGNITMIKANVIPINEITSDVANKIQDELNNKGRENIQIALRKFYRI